MHHPENALAVRPETEEREGFSNRLVLLEGAAGKRRYRSWKSMSDDDMVKAAQRVIDEGKVPCKTRLWDVDAGLADRLRKRGLWGRVSFWKEGAQPPAEPARSEVKSEPVARKEEKPAASGWEKGDVMFLAQSAIEERGIHEPAGLEMLDPDLYALAAEHGVLAELRFVEKAGAEEDGSKAGELLRLGAGQVRKAPLKGLELCEEEVYRLILAECFRIGTGGPYMNGVRGTIPKLQSNINRKMSGPQHKMFRKCWDRMASEGVISYNQNSSAASVSLAVHEVRDESLASALAWASAEHSKVSERR